eukprot:11886151-Ditylum_brightwellii.AAC.1
MKRSIQGNNIGRESQVDVNKDELTKKHGTICGLANTDKYIVRAKIIIPKHKSTTGHAKTCLKYLDKL